MLIVFGLIFTLVFIVANDINNYVNKLYGEHMTLEYDILTIHF